MGPRWYDPVQLQQGFWQDALFLPTTQAGLLWYKEQQLHLDSLSSIKKSRQYYWNINKANVTPRCPTGTTAFQWLAWICPPVAQETADDLRWHTVNAKNKYQSVEISEQSFSFKSWSRSEYSPACTAHFQKSLPCLDFYHPSPVTFIFSKNSFPTF